MSIDKNTNLSPTSARHQQQQQHSAQGHDDHHDSDDSLDSSPEDDHALPANASAAQNAHSAVADGQQPKRKGGRKPVSARELPPSSSMQCKAVCKACSHLETCSPAISSRLEVILSVDSVWKGSCLYTPGHMQIERLIYVQH